MPSDTLRVVARITARPDSVARVRDVLSGLIGPTRGEDGCIRYELMQNAGDPTDFTFYEEWTDEAALAVHAASAHLKRAHEELQRHLAAPADVRRYRVIG
jgi:quinol monooxygenase YgiN